MFLVGISDCSLKTETRYHRWLANATMRAILSIEPYPGVPDHPGPQVEFRLDELVGFGNRQLHQGAAAFLELLLEFGRGNPCLLAQAPENFGRGAGGCEQADPGF